MKPTDERRLGALLVALQLLLLGGLAGLVAVGWARAPAPMLSLAPAALAVLVGLAAVLANRPGNFNVHPEPKAGGQLVQHGIYAHIRHPMYAALLLAALAVVTLLPGWASATLAVALALVLWTKSSLEERWMARVHPGYAAYRARTRRFVPGLI
ncbi:hypothetical protein CKO44_21300 [Rubrivivax gelatinosus]|uniref:Protein-S-isoprenylcysteine O-methyltransferase Ste14 n=1 Tax=Rubrivivax gelatinosus TaxID=28068 RepID=A0ABS1DX44_RUBGE|nr:methyltransferase [Rubrivivax gelatinosus]MBK1615993.1 hypothetical protein [Rubrivivax gelatinosus]MBK1713914.1 hypothetical protein [Rubrivivax gelatinosus]